MNFICKLKHYIFTSKILIRFLIINLKKVVYQHTLKKKD